MFFLVIPPNVVLDITILCNTLKDLNFIQGHICNLIVAENTPTQHSKNQILSANGREQLT